MITAAIVIVALVLAAIAIGDVLVLRGAPHDHAQDDADQLAYLRDHNHDRGNDAA